MEYYAKIKHIPKGIFTLHVSIWEENPDTKINRIVDTKKFIRYNSAYKWAARKIFAKAMNSSDAVFLRDLDIIRKDYNGEH